MWQARQPPRTRVGSSRRRRMRCTSSRLSGAVRMRRPQAIMATRRWQDSYRARATPHGLWPGLGNHAAWRRFCRGTSTTVGELRRATPPRYRVSTRNIGAVKLALDAELGDARLERGRLEPEALRRPALTPDPPADLLEHRDDVSSLNRLQRHLGRRLLDRRGRRLDVQDRTGTEDDG